MPEPVFADTPSKPARTRRASRILVIEDNRDVREMLRLHLELDGYEVHEAADGVAAVRLALQLKPEVALVDIGLPVPDGYEVARRIRVSPSVAAMRLIAVTGYTQPEDIERARSADFDEHLAKPVDPTNLSNLLASQPTG